MKEKWLLRKAGADYHTLAKKLDTDPVIVRILRNRGLHTEEEMRAFLNADSSTLHDPHLLYGGERAAALLAQKVRTGAPIRIIGDYDIDGVMATYIYSSALKRVGAAADHVIPDRIRDGFGVNIDLIRAARADGIDTILTCDNGISAEEPIRLAKEQGMTVIVTDHHEVPFDEADGVYTERLVPADVIVNIRQSAETYPFRELCGAAVAYKLVCLLYEQMGIDPAEADEFIEYAGFATIGDVMDLQGENRTLASLSLKALEHTQNIGMRALIEKNELNNGAIKSYHVGFRLGPCINAGGRLKTALLALELLESTDSAQAAQRASELYSLNEERKEKTEKAVTQAIAQIDAKEQPDRVIVSYLPDCHESIAGIVAGRLRERYHRPVLVITDAQEGAKGSGRSIEEYSMYEELSRCGDLFTKFGGHSMAAGFSLKKENIPMLRERLNDNATLTQEQLLPKVHIDVDMPIHYITDALIHELDRLEPFGKGNPRPVFAQRDLQLLSLRRIGSQGQYLRLRLSDGRRAYDAMVFDCPEDLYTILEEKYGREIAERAWNGRVDGDLRISVCYYPQIHTFQGVSSIQLLISHIG